MTKTHAVNTTGDAERHYLEQLRDVYNHTVGRANTLTGHQFTRAKDELKKQAAFYKCISGCDITDREVRRG